ncbi:MAG: hypothetical protein ACW99U_20920 [Candidatus Thorarchaeota archaeon]|jgi:hypothetical protein
MTFGNKELKQLKDDLEALIVADYGAAVGAKVREYYDQALKDMIIDDAKANVMRELDSILDSPA